jgi:hypothetical protein
MKAASSDGSDAACSLRTGGCRHFTVTADRTITHQVLKSRGKLASFRGAVLSRLLTNAAWVELGEPVLFTHVRHDSGIVAGGGNRAPQRSSHIVPVGRRIIVS